MLRYALILAAVLSPSSLRADEPSPVKQEAAHLGNIRLVPSGMRRAGEGYFSPDGTQIVYKAYPDGYQFYQIFTQKLGENVPRLVSTGRGRTTCAYFSPDGKKLIFASAHTRPDLAQAENDARELEKQGGRRAYQWVFDEYSDIYEIDVDGGGLRALTDAPGYDAEGSYSSDGRQIVFTSNRDGDPDLYVMNADGSNVRQLTNAPGYDGGPFFSPDNKWVIFRSDRQKKDMLQLFAVSADGKHEVQLTDNLDTVNWGPYFHPGGKYIIWARADYSRGPQGANFDLYTMDVTMTADSFTGGEAQRVTFHEKADVLPVFSPDGTKLMWTSSRTEDGSSQLWIADWLRQ